MQNSTAILIGFGRMVLAILFTAAVYGLAATSPANAENLDTLDYQMFSGGFREIANAIEGIQACRN